MCRQIYLVCMLAYLYDLVPGTQAFLLSRTALLNTCNEDAHSVAPCQSEAQAVPLLEARHHCVRPVGTALR